MQNASNLSQTLYSDIGDYHIHVPYSLPVWVSIVLLTLYVISVVISLGGNIVICALIFVKKNLRNTGNYFVLSLALSDIIMVILCVPFTVLANLVFFQWIFGSFMCPVVGYLQLSSVIQRTLVLVAAAADRHRAIWKPMGKRFTKKTVLILLAIIWVASLLIPIPIARFSKLVSMSHKISGQLCQEVWPRENERFAFGIAMLAITYVIPMLVLCFTYGHIVTIIGNKAPGEGDAMRDRRRIDAKRKVRDKGHLHKIN